MQQDVFFLQQEKKQQTGNKEFVILHVERRTIMNITYFFKEELSKKTIELHAHPDNERPLRSLGELFESQQQISVINPVNNRILLVKMADIERIESFGHLCKVFTEEKKDYLIQKRLKAIVDSELPNFQRINNSTLLNLTKIKAFATGEYARLEVHTYSEQTYVVSRHYAKKIKEKLS